MTALVTGPVSDAPLQTLSPLRKPAWWVLPAAAVLLTGLIMLALAGAALDDAEIDAHPGHATAQVLAVTSMRTLVQFATPDGKVFRPDAGLAYPSGLQVGQLVRVDYDSSDPVGDVRVAGRTWVQGVAPASITVLAAWALVAPATWWFRRRRRPAA
jgi:heme A synthase